MSNNQERNRNKLTRRAFLNRSVRTAAAAGITCTGGALGVPLAHASGAEDFGPLGAPDSNGLRLPMGFTSRVIARSGNAVATTNHIWHDDPDGGATFATPDGGWIYVSNSETGGGGGGVGAIRFSANGAIQDAYSILSGTTRNCAGGPTPWNRWLSCEEVNTGLVWDCDPMTPSSSGIARPALGRFNHEAVAVDPVRKHLYLTEDKSNGLLYRFTPTTYPDLGSGLLEAAQIRDPEGLGAIAPGETRPLDWHVVPDPSAATTSTRLQVPNATAFNGGEGCWYAENQITFSTKGDNRIWQIQAESDTIEILYDFATSPTPILSGVDNVYVSPIGDIYVAEDPGQLQIVALTPSGGVSPIVQITGQSGTEVTGPALSPDGTRLYFSSQRGPGTTYEVSGPFAAPQAPALGQLSHWLLMASLGLGASGALIQKKSIRDTF